MTHVILQSHALAHRSAYTCAQLEAGIPLTLFRPEYRGANTYEAALAYISLQFLSKVPLGFRKETYVIAACRTDPHILHDFFASVKDIALRRSLTEAQLMTPY